jgi:hypothetical protein
MPAIVLIASWALNVLAENERAKYGSHCLLILKQASGALVISVLILAVCALTIDFSKDELPYITTIIIFATMAVKLMIFFISHNFSRYCRGCKVRNGLSPHDAFVGNMIHNESKYQLKLAVIFSLLITIVTFITHDKQCIIYVPIAIYLLSIIYLACAYFYTVHFMHDAHIELCNNNITTLRYLVLYGDRLLIAKVPNKFSPKTMTIDTPASINIEYSREVPEHIATERFEALSNAKNFRLRKLYNNNSFAESANIFHYAIILDETEPLPTDWSLGDGWVTLDQINRVWRFGELSPALAAEIHRIYTITMAWKTYDRNGNRLYPIKNYYPTFRLRDFKNWDVDYNDMHWIYISDNNQDKPLFKVRKFIRKITTFHV